MSKPTALIVEDHKASLHTFADIVRGEGYEATLAANATEALAALKQAEFDLVLTDLRLPDKEGLAVLEETRRLSPDTPVIMITGHGTEEIAVEAMKRGATDYLTKPPDLHRLRAAIEAARQRRELLVDRRDLRAELEKHRAQEAFVGAAPPIRRIKEMIRQIGGTNATVLITGESGTGKEVIADCIKANSPRAAKPYIKVNVAALPRDLLESELFGHERGAFTGAIKTRKGRFELADGGTLFLDEIGEMPPETQVKLLRVLQEQAFERVGGTETIRTDVRLICATNQNLEQALKENRFRRDLYFRINVLQIHLPPLRERREDVPILVKHFLKMFPTAQGAPRECTEEAFAALRAYDWPGNVRELRNFLERASLLAGDGPIGLEHLPPELAGSTACAAAGPRLGVVVADRFPVGRRLEEVEHQYIQDTLENLNWNKTKAARQLGIGLKTLYRKIEKFKIEPGKR